MTRERSGGGLRGTIRPGTQKILNLQPVRPIHVDEDGIVIPRAVLSLTWWPSLRPVPNGHASMMVSTFPQPGKPVDPFAWGIGRALLVKAEALVLETVIWASRAPIRRRIRA